MLGLPVVWADDTLAHVPGVEIWIGVPTPGTELPERATVIRDAVVAAGASLLPATSHDDSVLRRVHSDGLLRHLETVYAEWAARGYQEHQHNVVPYVFPTAGMLDGLPAREPYATHGRAGLYMYDTMTLVGEGTWRAARAAVDAAQTAAELVAGGAPASYAICRPPGHHATRTAFGGSCYLNNAAVAVETLRSAGVDRVAVVDIDAHHGNGTQALCYDRPDVFYGSVHVDPGAGWFPHYAGYADETGRGAGDGCNRNVPLAPGTGDDGWLDGLAAVCAAAAVFRPDAVVVSLGVDAAADDPESPLQVTREGYRRSGALIRHIGVPIVAVHEGGYHLPTLGDLTVATLAGLTGT
ncbi:MAG TPA: histone deacetylase family protein [Micromonosporaceae bacterium]|nr:histone deacetylase family protein [Micromonosporaceae bacterium]